MAITGKELLENYKKRKQENTVSTEETTKTTGTKLTGSQLLENYKKSRGLIASTEEDTTTGENGGWFQKSSLFDDGYQFGDVFKTGVGTTTDLVTNLGAGVLGMGEKAVDAVASLIPGASDFVKKDLYDEEAIMKAIFSDSVKALTGIDSETDSVFGQKMDNLGQSAGQLLGTVGLQMAGVPWWVTTGVTTFGSETENAFNQGATQGEAIFSGLNSAAWEILSEKLSGGISFGGKTLDDVTVKPLLSKISNRTIRKLASLGFDMAGEGAEEIVSGVMSAVGQKLSYASESEFNELFSSEDALDSLIGGALLSFGGSAVRRAAQIPSNIKAKQTYGDNQSIEDLLVETANIGGETANVADWYTDKYGKKGKLSGADLNDIINAREQGLIAQDKSKMKMDIDAKLTEHGETGDISAIADVLVKQATGEKLKSKDWNILNESKAGHLVSTKMNPDNIKSGALNDDWATYMGTSRIRPDVYNREGYAFGKAIADASKHASLMDDERESVAKAIAESGGTEEAQIKVSDNGKNMYYDAEAKEYVDADIKRVVSTKGGIVVELENGKTVKASDLAYASRVEGVVYEMLARMDVTPDTANEILNTFKPSNEKQAELYYDSIPLAYRMGLMGNDQGLKYINLPDAQKRIVYNRGRMDAITNAKERDNARATSPKKTTAEASKTGKNGIIYEGDFVYDEATAEELQKAGMAGAEAIAKTTNLEVHVFESKVVDGKRVAYVNGKLVSAPNGYFTGGNKIYIDINAGMNAEGAMLYALAHEVTHYIRKWNAQGFKDLADFLFAEYGKHGVDVTGLISRQKDKIKKRRIEEAIANIKEQYKKEGKAIPTEAELQEMAKEALPSEAKIFDMAYEELVADAMSDMLADPKAYEKLAKFKKKNFKAWKKLGEIIKELLDKLKNALNLYKKDSPVAVEAYKVRDFSQEAYNKLQDLYIKAFAEADNNYSSAEQTLVDNGIAVNPDTDSASLLSVRDVLTDEQKKKVSLALATRFGVTQQEAMDWLKAETSMASLILNPKYSQYLDYTPDPNEVAIKQNSDYPQGTVDFSPICAKRREFTSVMNNILRLFPNHVFAATDLAKIRTIMQEEGMTIPCGICYVEDRRQLDTIVAQNFIDSLKLYREGSKTRPDGNPFNVNQLKGLSLIDGDSYTPSVYELVSLEGLNVLKEKNPNMAEAWVKFNNARGMQSVRLLANEAEYKRQILKYTKKTVQSKNDKGGLRVYSFSDAEMFHLIDIIQVITDSATVGLYLQGYTKVNEYARTVKDTGEKLNRSLIPKGELGYHIEDGKVVLDYDTVEGIDINHPDFFDNKDNPDIGNITIGVSDVQIRAAMVSDFVDQIIPFHTGQSEEVLGEKGISTWSNYKDFQGEKDIATGTKSEHQINIYTEVLQVLEKEGTPINKRTFVEKFLQVCKDNGLTPRFSQFLNIDENGEYAYTEGYHKMLVDFKTFAQTEVGEYLPQRAVKPIFDNEYITKILKDYVKSQKVKDAELAESMPKVIERITNEIVKPSDSEVKFSDRDNAPNEFNPDGKTLDEQLDDILHTSESYDGRYLYIGRFTPKFISMVSQHVEIKDLPIAMNYRDAYLSMENKEHGKYKGDGINYHNLGKEGLKSAIESFGSPEQVLLSKKEGKVELVLQGVDKKGNKLLSIVALNTRPRNAKKYIEAHIVTSIYGKSSIDRYVSKAEQEGRLIYNKKEESTQVNSQVQYEGIVNANSSVDSLAQNSNSVKSQFSEDDKVYSDRDSEGNILSKEQQEFFKDSKIRDKNGNLMKVYHGSPNKFFTFRQGVAEGWGRGIYFTDNRNAASDFGDNIVETYLNIKNPFNADTMSYEDIGAENTKAYREFDMQKWRRYYPEYDTYEEYQEDMGGVGMYEIYTEEVEVFNRILRELGYDGIIANGSNGIDGYEIVAFEENQPKLTTNKNPSSDPDMRYSDREIQPITDAEYETLKKHFGVTANFRVAGYLLPDGKLLDFSGKHWGDTTSRSRQVDHRDVQEVLERGNNGISDMVDMIGSGCIRLMPETGGINLAVYPNEKQRRVLSLYIKQMLATEGQVIIDYDAVGGDTVHSRVYEKYASSTQILSDIRNYFNGARQSDLMQFHTSYSDRDTDAVSNRTLLANALESVAQNDIEKAKLAQYKKKIALIEAEQRKLNDIKARANAIRFTKGRTSAETKQMHDLDFEATQTANRINTYDKQLLNLESTSALKNVLEREKTILRKRLEKQGKEALAKQKEKNAETVREIMNRNTASRKKAVESRHKTEMRRDIKKLLQRLNKLFKGGKERNVKEGMKEAVSTALALGDVLLSNEISNVDIVNLGVESVTEKESKHLDEYRDLLMKKESNLDRIRTLRATLDADNKEQVYEYISELEAQIRKYDRRMSELNGLLADVFVRERARLNRMPVNTLIDELASEYQKLKSAKDDYVKNAYDSNLYDMLVSLKEKLGGVIARDMSLYQLEQVKKVFTMLEHSIRTANQEFRNGKWEDLQESASAVMEEIEPLPNVKQEGSSASSTIRSFLWNELTPYYAFDKIGSKTLMAYFKDLMRGQAIAARDSAESKAFAQATREKYNYSKWKLDEIHEFQLSDGRTFRTTLKHLLSVYAYSKREQADLHMSIGGFFHNDKATFRKEKGILKMVRTDAVGYKVDANVLAQIKTALGNEKMSYVDEMVDYLTKMGEKGNEVSNILYGVDIFTEKVYFPLKSKEDFLKKSTETAQAVSLKNDGMTKETVPGASNPIVLEAFDDVWANHVERMSVYHGFVIPIDNLNKVLHYGTWVGTDAMSVSTMLEGKFTSAATDYLEQFINDLNGGAVVRGATNPFMSFFAKFKKTAVGASLSTVVQQPTAIVRAMAEIDAKYFVGKPHLTKLSERLEELKTYAPIAIIKEIGGFDAGGSKSIARWINSDTLTGIDKVMNTIDDVSMKGAEYADWIGWLTIWEAVKRETKATTDLALDSKEFLEKCGERFEEIIMKTQVYDSTLSRSGFMRSKNDGVKMLTSFMGEPTLSINMLYSAVINAMRGGKEAKLKAAKTIGFVYLAMVLAEALSSAIYALRDDDEDESYMEKYLQSLGGSVISDIVLAPVTSLPGVKDVVSIFQGWDVERSDMAIFKDIKDAFDGLDSDSKSSYRKVEDFAGAIAAAFGLPLKNVLRTGREVYNVGSHAFDDVSGGSAWDAFSEGITGKSSTDSKKLYKAILKGDASRYRDQYKTEAAFESAVRQALRDNDSRIKKAAQARYEGNIAEYTRIAKEIIREGKFSQDIVVGAINAEMNAIRRGETIESESTDDIDEVTSIYSGSDINSALDNGDYTLAKQIISELIETKVANGMEEKNAISSLRSSMTSYWKPLYKKAYSTGNNSEMARIRKILYASGLYGTSNDVVKTTQNWLKS